MKDLKALLAQMTLEEKVGQLIQVGTQFFGSDVELTGPAQEWGLTAERLPTIGSCIGGKNAAKIRKIQEGHLKRDRNKIPLLFMRDVIHGYRTVYPINLALAGSFNPEIVKECTEMAAREAAAGGVHITFAPMVDLSRDPRWGRVMEGCGEDPYLASVMAAAQVKAYQGDDLRSPDHIGACVKHFAAYGGAEGGRDYDTVDMSERTLRQFYLPAYKACVDADVKLLMPSFNNLNGIPSTANPLLKKILRDEWGYDGVAISDWAAIVELCEHGVAENYKEAARMAFKNGCTIEMESGAYYKHLTELVEEGVIKESEIDEAVMRVLKLKDELGLFEDPFHGADDERGEKMYLSAAHRDIARRAAEESAVLLKNDGTLPFSKDIKKLALIGPFADDNIILGSWAITGKYDECVTVKEGVENLIKNTEIRIAHGCGNLITDTDKSGFDEAIEIAKSADAVLLCIGEHENYSGESECRTDIRLPGVQAELVKAICEANKNTAVVLFCGRPLDLSNIYGAAPAILNIWFPGNEGGNAVANLVFGEANPSGKLPMSFPKAVGQCPVYYNRTNSGRPKENQDVPNTVFQCRTGYLDCGNLPLFFFGEGHSYTEFKYEKMTLNKSEITKDDTLNVTVTLTNVGKMRGKEVVQLYLRDMVSSAVRPIQELIAFKKVELDAGESREVRFEITEPMLRFFDAECNFISEPGEFSLFVGYADHPYLSDKFRLK